MDIRVFISQPMRGKSNEEIIKERKKAYENIKRLYPNDNIIVIDSFFKDAPHDAKPLFYLANALMLLSTADVAYFTKDYYNARGCKIEYECALNYGIDIIDEVTLD